MEDEMEKVEKRNNYFYTSAILGIILACIEILCGIIAISIFFSMKETIDPTRVDFVQGLVVTATIILIVFGILSIIVNCFFFKFAGYSQEKINNQTAFIVLMIVLQLLFGGLIACAVSVAGIIAGREGEMARINYDKVEELTVEGRLKKVKQLYDDGLIDEAEYKKLKMEILVDRQDI